MHQVSKAKQEPLAQKVIGGQRAKKEQKGTGELKVSGMGIPKRTIFQACTVLATSESDNMQ